MARNFGTDVLDTVWAWLNYVKGSCKFLRETQMIGRGGQEFPILEKWGLNWECLSPL